MYVIYIIEDKPKIFTLLQNIIFSMRKEKYIFVDGEIVFSNDIEKNFTDDCVLIFQLITLVNSKLYKNDYFTNINLAFVGDIDRKIDMNDLSNVDSLMLNTENLTKIENIEKVKQVITCGLKEKDTVTFSSIEEDNIILNVQRTIKNIKNEGVEPFEKKIYIEDVQIKESIFRHSSDVTHEDLITALSILLFCNIL